MVGSPVAWGQRLLHGDYVFLPDQRLRWGHQPYKNPNKKEPSNGKGERAWVPEGLTPRSRLEGSGVGVLL